MTQNYTLTEYAQMVGVTRQAAHGHVTRGQWMLPDGRMCQATKKGRQWDIQVSDPEQNQERRVTPDGLKMQKMIEEIRLLRNRNEKLWDERFSEVLEMSRQAMASCFAQIGSAINSLRLDRETIERIEKVRKPVVERVDDAFAEQLEAWKERNRVR